MSKRGVEMFKSEAEKLKEIYENQVTTTQEEFDDFVRHAMPYLRAMVEWYDKNQAAAMAVRQLGSKLARFGKEEEDGV